MASYLVGRQPPGASNAARALDLKIGNSLAVGLYAVGEVKVPNISWTILSQAMQEQMRKIQKQAVANLEERLVRPDESTGRLARETGSPQNVELFTEAGKPTGFAVGLTGFLNAEESEVRYYWRAIEEGSERFLGRSLLVLRPGKYGPTRGRTLEQDPGLRDMKNISRVRGKVVTVDKPILAHRYYRDAWEQTATPARMERALMAWARANGLPLEVRGVGESRRIGALRG